MLLPLKQAVKVTEVAETALQRGLCYRHVLKTQHLPGAFYSVVIQVVYGCFARYLFKDFAKILRIQPRNARKVLQFDRFGIVVSDLGKHVGDAKNTIRERRLESVIHRVVEQGTPFLGICLGLQLLFERSEEAPGAEGLGILKGEILKIPEKEGMKIPHMGWNSLHLEHNGRLFRGIPEGAYVYFVHSYYLKAADEQIVKASTDYCTHIHASVEKDNVFACQFHPEKSSDVGLQILKNFVEL